MDKNIKFENIEFKSPINENEINPEEKARVDKLIDQLEYECEKVIKRLKDEKRNSI